MVAAFRANFCRSVSKLVSCFAYTCIDTCLRPIRHLFITHSLLRGAHVVVGCIFDSSGFAFLATQFVIFLKALCVVDTLEILDRAALTRGVVSMVDSDTGQQIVAAGM